MPSRRWPAVVVAGIVAMLLPGVAAPQEPPCDNPFSVTQSFPTLGAEQTRWEVTGCSRMPNGVVITTTRFWKSPSVPIQLFHDARVSEIFVVYDDGLRFYDISEVSTGPLPLSVSECPAAVGQLMAADTVCREVRDRGLAFRDDTSARRGEELVLWGIIGADNYKYVVEWRFRDDGVVLGRVGATGRNAPGAHHVSHVHSVTWRLDIDLDGPGGDSVRTHAHHDPSVSGLSGDREALIGKERGIVWAPVQFTTLHISDATLVNAQGKRSQYVLIPERSGTARHAEAHSKQDFWVTRSRGKGLELQARDLPRYISPQESVANTDLVVWYTGSLHHEERDEDDGGPTHIMWIGFTLKPHDLFDSSPLYP